MKYEPSLDGLRAVAILAVLVFHASPRTLVGGFTGVDVFFVLSGYLITSVILHDLRDREFSMREFYLRRVQRLLPNAAVMVLVTVALSVVALLPTSAVKVAQHGLFTLFNLSNIFLWRSVGGYWADSAASAPLLHTWSLAVEEQFYLVFPAILWILARRPRLFGLAVTAILALVSFGFGVKGTFDHPVATFYLLPTRAWEPLLGAVLAVYRIPAAQDRPLRSFSASAATELAGVLGLATIVFGFFFITEEGHFPGTIALLPTIGTFGVLVSIADGKTRMARLLARPFLVWIGKLSYSLYLWHWPLIVIGRTYAGATDRSPTMGTLIGAAVSVVLSVVAYRVVEEPFRRRDAGRKRRLLVLAAGLAFCVAASLIVALRRPAADAQGVFDRPAFRGSLYNAAGDGSSDELVGATRYADVVVPPAEPRPADVWRSGGILHAWGKTPPRVVVLGSSHALMYGSLIDDICKKAGTSVAFLSVDGSEVFFRADEGPASPARAPSHFEDFDAIRMKWLREWKPDLILAIDRWDTRWEGNSPLGFEKKLRAFVRALEPHTRHIVLLSQVPVLRLGENENLREFVTWRLRRDGSLPRIAADPKESIRQSTIAILEAVSRETPKVRLLRADQPFYLEDGTIRYASGRSFLYADDDHLSEAGAELLREPLSQAIKEGLAR